MPAKRQKQHASPAADAFAAMFDAYDHVLNSIRGYDGKPAQATELERIALMNRIRKRLAVNARMPPGYNGALTVQETAHRLGIGTHQVYRLCNEGRLNGIKVDGRIYIPPEEVRAYKRLQEIWSAQGGRWTPYGREEKKEPEAQYKPVETTGAPSEEGSFPSHSSHMSHSQQAQEERWITCEEAAAILGVCPGYIRQFAQIHKLERKPVPTTRGRPRINFRLDEIMRLVGERESKAWKRGITPQQWNHDLRHPIIRTKVEAPPNDSLISCRDAAEILGARRQRVSDLVAEGRLFGWQTKPGRQGCRLFLSTRQVMRYAEDPMRMKRRLAAVDGEAPPELKTGNDWTEWRDWHGLYRYEGCHSDRDRGEFMTTYHAAELLGIKPRTLLELRARGRIKGYHATTVKPNQKRPWWFFRRDEVEDLLADRDYARRRRAARKALAAARVRKNELPAIIYSRYRDITDS